MKGYYTVKLLGGNLPDGVRITLETRYAQALESLLGGAENVRDLCLRSAADAGPSASMDDALRAACLTAEAVAWSGRERGADTRFALNAWQAIDLA